MSPSPATLEEVLKNQRRQAWELKALRDALTGTVEIWGKADVAKHLKITVRTLDRWIATRKFPKGKAIGREMVWLASTVAAWVEGV